jgi:hypothetical protein
VRRSFNTSSGKAKGRRQLRLDISFIFEGSSPFLSRVPSRRHSMIRISKPKMFGSRKHERRQLRTLEFKRFATVEVVGTHRDG